MQQILFLPLAFLRVSALPELNYTALANEASVYAIAQYHAILSSAAGTTTILCSVVNLSVMRLRDVLSERGNASRLSE
jgi:hypothetical protein